MVQYVPQPTHPIVTVQKMQKLIFLCVCVLTSYIEIDQPLIFAHFVLSRAHVHDRNAGVAYLKPAHGLLGEKRRMRHIVHSEKEVQSAVLQLSRH